MSGDEPPPVAGPRWSYWLIAAVVAVGFLASIWWVGEREPPQSHSSATTTAADSLLRGFPPAFNDPRPDLSQRPDFVDVCGVGRVRLLPDGNFDLPDQVTASDQWLDRVAARLAASGDDYDRAVGLYAQSLRAAHRAMLDHWATHPDCNRDEQCEKEATALAQQAGAPASDLLARHAVVSRNPRIYALAYFRCGSAAANPPASGACAQISAAQWAQIEPDNAAPWLYEAEVAAQRKDAKAVDEAMLRASKAKAMWVHDEAPLRFMDRGILRTDDPVTIAMAQMQSIGIRAAFPAPDAVALRYCRPSQTMDDSRQLLCRDLADVLAERGSSLLSMGVGASIGERAGWAPERVAATRDFASAITQLWQESYDVKDLYSCRTLELNNKHFGEILQYGEVEAARRQIQASGRSVAELARQRKAGLSARKDEK